jgi:hypothetical protein
MRPAGTRDDQRGEFSDAGGSGTRVAQAFPMFRLRTRKRRSLTVATVAADLSKLDSLERYLRGRVSVRAVSALEGAFATLAASDAVVFYPDGFAISAVRHFLRRLIGHTGLALVIVVTAEPERFQPLERARATANRFIVLSAPVWPWELLATMRSSVPGLREEDAGTC